MTKDYYRILGVLDDAEDVVIRAAYKALAQRYHPDKWTGDKEEANRRMQEINEAYGVLSDSAKRKQYDATRKSNDYENVSGSEDDTFENELDADWEIACKFFPEIDDKYKEMKKISFLLANTFRTHLLETKKYDDSLNIANKFIKRFLEKFFGKNESILSYAKEILLSGNVSAARRLNQIVLVMGESVSPLQIKFIIEKEFPNLKITTVIDEIIERFNSPPYPAKDAIFLIKYVTNNDVKESNVVFSTLYEFTWIDGNSKHLDFAQLIAFTKQVVIPHIKNNLQ